MKKHLSEIKEAVDLYSAEKMTESESNALRAAYLDAVKKLHPDINHDLPEAAKELWNQIQTAHSEKNWRNVSFLCGLVEGVVGGKTHFAHSPDGMTSLKEEIAALEEKARLLRERIASLKSRKPFIYEDILSDAAKVEARKSALFSQIKSLEKSVEEYEKLWNDVK